MQDARVTIMGLGRFGGGVGVTRYLAERGAKIIVSDRADPASLAPSLALVQDLVDSGRVTLELGEHRAASFTGRDVVIVNPAVPWPWTNELIAAARRSGARIATEIELLIEQLGAATVVGVTGTAGKSTTATMIHHGLRTLGRDAALGGNIGGSLLDRVDELNDSIVVLELSSAMLYWLGEGRTAGWTPDVAVITNLFENHADWHGGFAHYAASKSRICGGNRLIHPAGCAGARHIRQWAAGCTGVWSIDDAEPIDDLQLPGRHNAANAHLAAAAIGATLSGDPAVDIDAHRAAVAGFRGLPHRLELVGEIGGARCFNDSKSTTPGATALAVESFDDPRRVHLIAGGYDKKIDLAGISRLASRLGGLYAIGATAETITAAAGSERAVACGTLDAAVNHALQRLGPGDVLLMSPGCASWDQFENFEARGRVFVDLVRHAGRVHDSATHVPRDLTSTKQPNPARGS